MTPNDPLRNPKDPLLAAGSQAEHELFRAICRLCAGFPQDVVRNVAGNLLINSIRQDKAQWPQAEAEMSEQLNRLMGLLKSHYDTVSGRKKGVFPYDQTINVPLLKMKNGTRS